MALTGDILLDRRGPERSANEFGYPLAAGEKCYLGSLLALNSSGYLVRVQTAGAQVLLGPADRNLDNSASSSPSTTLVVPRKGTFKLPVTGATVANITQPVYASDDGTLGLVGANSAAFALGGSDTGTGGVAGLAAAAGAKQGAYTITILSGANTFSITDPNGDALANGTLGTAYSAGGVSFTLSNGGARNFVAGDTATITVTEAATAMLAGTLAGIEGGNTWVNIAGS